VHHVERHASQMMAVNQSLQLMSSRLGERESVKHQRHLYSGRHSLPSHHRKITGDLRYDQLPVFVSEGDCDLVTSGFPVRAHDLDGEPSAGEVCGKLCYGLREKRSHGVSPTLYSHHKSARLRALQSGIDAIPRNGNHAQSTS